MSVDSIKKLLFPFCAVLLAACGGDNGKAGAPGAPGAPALVMTYAESAGANCGTGGWRIETGSDTNRSGTLDQAEVTGVSFICNGEDGQDGSDGASGADGSAGLTALLSLSSEPAGANCAQGGQRVDTGLDLNTDGTLDPAEITSTAFICNGADGQDGVDGTDGIDGTFALIDTQVEPAGVQCANGGIRVTSGIDANRNGLLEIAEISRTSYLCNGDDGVDGSDGQNGAAALIASTQIPAGIECAAGGYRVDSGIDGNENGLLDSIEVSASFYVCNGNDGADGQPGENGVDGSDGLVSLVKVSDVAPGASCIAGGKLIETGNDLNSDGVLQAGEVQQSEYVCNGEVGQDGVDGQNGSNALVALADESPGANCAAGGVAVNSGMDINANGQLDSAEIQSTSYVCHGTGGPDAQTFTLNYSAQPGGSIVGSAVQNVLLGDNGSVVTAVPNVGYFFTAWSDGLSTATRAEIAVQSSVSVQAGFSPYEYILTYVAGSNGSVTGITNQTVFYGANGSAVTAIPSEGYEFVEWSDGLTANPRSDLAVDESVAVTARFEKRQYTLTYQAGPGGSVTGNANQVVLHGDNGLVVAAVPSDGYNFIRWSDGLTTTNRTDSNIQSDLLLIAEFRQQLSPPEDVVLGASNGSLVVEWESNPAADSYNVYYALEPGVTPLNYSSLLGGGVIIGASSPTTLTELSGGQRYYFVITTIIDGVESQPGQEITQLLPNTPWLIRAHQGGLRVELTSATTAVVDWDVGFAESYNLFIADNPETDLSQYSSYGAELRLSVTPPVTIENLEIDKPVYIALETDGQIEDWTNTVSLTWGVNGYVEAQVLGEDSARYVGGTFNFAGMNTGSAVLFPLSNSNESPHLISFPEVNGVVHAASGDGRGGWYIGGEFSRVANAPRMNLAHVDSSGRLTDWNPGVDGPVHAIAVHEGVVVVGGDFSGAGNFSATIARSRFAAFDEAGALLPWNPIFDAAVRVLHVANDHLYVGGDFTLVSGAWGVSGSDGLAAFRIDTGMVKRLSQANYGSVHALASDKHGNLFVGVGAYYSGSYLYAINTESGDISTSWTPLITGPVYTMALDGDNLYVGGSFTSARSSGSTQTQPRSRLAAFRAPSATSSGLLLSWAPPVSVVKSMFVKDDAVYVSTSSSGYPGISAFYKGDVEFPLVPGSLVNWMPKVGGPVNVIASSGDVFFAGGSFSVAGGERRLNLAAFDEQGYLKDWNPGVSGGASSGVVQALDFYNGTIYVGGRFTSAGDGFGSLPRFRLAAFDESANLMAWNPGVDVGQNASGACREVRVIKAEAGKVYVGGAFSNIAGGAATGLAAVDVSGALSSWVPTISYSGCPSVSDLVIGDSAIYVGGRFSAIASGGVSYPRTNIASISFSGGINSWAPTLNGDVSSIAIANSVVYVGGSFTAATGASGGATRLSIASFDLSGNLTTWGPRLDGAPSDLTVGNGALYVAGSFNSVIEGPQSYLRSGIASFDLRNL